MLQHHRQQHARRRRDHASTSPTATTTPDTGAPDATATSKPDAAVTLPPPASFDITSSALCAYRAPCGGALEGTWDYSAACVPTSALSNLASACPTAEVTKIAGKMSGRLIIAGSTIERKATLAVTADITVPVSCAQPVGGCASVGTVLQSGPGVKSATCTGGAGPCACVVDADLVLDKSGTTFTVAGSTLTTSDGDEYAFCVTGGTLTHQQTKSGTPNKSELGGYEATKR